MVIRMKTTDVTAKAVAVPTGRRKRFSFSITAASLILQSLFQSGERGGHDAPHHRQSVRAALVKRISAGVMVAPQKGSKVDDVH